MFRGRLFDLYACVACRIYYKKSYSVTVLQRALPGSYSVTVLQRSGQCAALLTVYFLFVFVEKIKNRLKYLHNSNKCCTFAVAKARSSFFECAKICRWA